MTLLSQLVTTLSLAPLAAMLAAYFRYRIIIVKERHKTKRMTAALDGTSPEQRASIIQACGSLETPPDAPLRRPPH